MKPILRKCGKCKLEKPLEEFYTRKSSKRLKHNKSNYCKKCERNTRNSRDRNSINWTAKVHRFKRQGIVLTKELYDQLYNRAKGKCEICGRTSCVDSRNKVLVIDHDHTTLKIRGLLCDNCNMGIGKLNDSPDLLRKALEYLEKNK